MFLRFDVDWGFWIDTIPILLCLFANLLKYLYLLEIVPFFSFIRHN
jgi:hypothetical protein